jgi:ankyrin repeat protein
VDAADPDLAQLLTAANDGELQTVAAMVRKRPEIVNAHGPDGQTALHVAAQCNDPRLGVYLVSAGADIDATFGQSGHTALSWAVVCHAIEFAQAMMRLGAKPDLFCAAGIGAIEEVAGWFDASSGAMRPNASRTGSSRYDVDGARLPCPPETPVEVVSDALYMASRNGQAEVVRFLLRKQPDLSFRAYLGGTPLHWAYFSGSREVVDLLMRAGADATLRDDEIGCTPRAFGICTMANWGFAFLVRRELLADPTLAQVLDGTSPLHEAARGGHLETVQILIAAGADRATRDRDGRTAGELAAENGHAAVGKLLSGT